MTPAPHDPHRTDVLVVGGGNAGISLAARLLRTGTARDVALVEPSPVHRYRPLLNYVGGGEATTADLERPMVDVVPDGVRWVRDAVDGVDLDARTVTTRRGRTLAWSRLVLCPGLDEDWAATPGLQDAYAAGWAFSTYVPAAAPLVWPALRRLREGTVLFTVPPEPAGCAPTALKPLLMACGHWQRRGVLDDLRVVLALPLRHAIGVPDADARLEEVLAGYGVEVWREATVESVDPVVRTVEVRTPTLTRRLEDLALAHAVPHYTAPGWIEASGLADGDPAGLVDIDPETLRARAHPDVWAIGDAAALRTTSSGGALRKQVDVLVHNLAAAAAGGRLRRYDGYTVAPITTSRRRLLLVETDRSGARRRRLPLLSRARPRLSAWLLDRYVLPRWYWRGILRGRV
ncbi:FAD/NAD(P)-binding oxidoreductase [Aquipuribacter sp. SD81]|uniref:FAD/NAD(P)-binding oxidoreductase n=1 Tax=Aquipuribacter sp. SD81 TaxID=3127703 RepID=UPI003017A53C